MALSQAWAQKIFELALNSLILFDVGATFDFPLFLHAPHPLPQLGHTGDIKGPQCATGHHQGNAQDVDGSDLQGLGCFLSQTDCFSGWGVGLLVEVRDRGNIATHEGSAGSKNGEADASSSKEEERELATRAGC